MDTRLTDNGLVTGCMRGGAGAEELRDGAGRRSALISRALKRVLLGAVGQGHCLGEHGAHIYPTERESQLWLCLEKGTGYEILCPSEGGRS